MGMGRRQFLVRGLALGCSAAASPLVTPVAMAAAPWDQRLVVILLRGAMDGLDVVRPLGDRNFAALRPDLTGATGHRDLDGFFALHDGLAGLMPLWRAGELSFVHAVSTPYRDRRSHFDGQDLLEAGIPDLESGVHDGWLNRMLATVPGLEPEIAYAVEERAMLILSGEAPVSSWAPAVRMQLSPATEELLAHVWHDDPLFHEAGAAALSIARTVRDREGTGEAVGQGPHVELARFVAERLMGDTRIASFSINGWDTHQSQGPRIRRVLEDLGETILTLKAGLSEAAWARTAVVCMTEFGRTARQNGSNVTDHGTGGAMVLAGGAVRGGRVLGDWPVLAEADLYNSRDLLPTRDVRAHAGWLLRGLYGLPGQTIERAVFPGLELGPDPGLLL